jgi:hypothetical protein
MACVLSALGFRPNRNVRSQIMVFSRLGGNFLGVVEAMKETQSMADFAKQVAKFGESVMKHERNYTWRCLDVCFDDLLAPRQAWIMWNDRKAHAEVLTKHDARVENNKLCLSLEGTKLGGKLVREVGFYYKQKLCCISGKSYTHRAKLDALNSLAGLTSLGLKNISIDISCLPESLLVLETNNTVIDRLVLPRSLQSLALQVTSFGGTSLQRMVENHKGLTQLSVSRSPYMSEIPTELGSLVSLKRLCLTDAKMVCKIPSELGLLTNLATLWLDNNQLTGRLPSELGNLARLTYVSVSNNFLNQTIPSEFGKLCALRSLSASRNKLSGSIPTELGYLTNLRHLFLSDNNLCEASLRLTNLEALDLSYNCLRSFPCGVLSSSLVYLNLSYNFIASELPAELSLLKKTCKINIQNNFLHTTNFR